MPFVQQALPFLLSLGIGLMLGVERERRPEARVGLRSFALIGLLGTGLALISQVMGSPLPFSMGLGAVLAALAFIKVSQGAEDPDAVTIIAALLCYSFGGLAWYGYSSLLAVLALTVTCLLYFKAELHGLSHRLSRQDLLSILQFALISCIILPLLPDQGYGPYQALNPFRLWALVVMISGVGLAGYAFLRILGPDKGILALGFFGGVVSSTATTLVFARRLRRGEVGSPLASFIILAANLMVPIRLTAVAAMLDATVLPRLVPLLGGALLGGLAYLGLQRRNLESLTAQPELEISNPAEVRSALTFAAMFGVVLLVSEWLHDLAGDSGVFAVAMISGMTDVDAIALSALEMHGHGRIVVDVAVNAMAIAYATNLVFKIVIAGVAGGRALVRPVATGFAAVAGGLCLGLLYNLISS